jgi:glutamate-1-semialdehyde 2,1-aminomutase
VTDRNRLGSLLARERAAFAAGHPRSAQAFAAAQHLFGGVPMTCLATRYAGGVRDIFAARAAPWSVSQLGARAEYRFAARPPRTGTESHLAGDPELDDYFHLYLVNRGVLLTPFHNMALMCPDTTAAQVDLHLALLRDAVAELLA